MCTCTCACVHAQRVKSCTDLWAVYDPHILAKWSEIFTKLSAYVKIGLLSWLIMFLGVHVYVCMHSEWKHAHNLGQYTNPHISAEWSQIFTKLSAYIELGVLSWFITFVGVHVHVCMHSMWNHACNFGSIQTIISRPNEVRYSGIFQHMSRLVSWAD